jgi:hypothetical protein
MTTAKRSASLHASYGGDGFVQMIAAVVLGGLATFSLWLSLCYLRREMWNVMEIDRTAITVILPIALWTTGWFLTVVRFLGYLDLRIRREGWEVELRMRAEALAMSGATRSDAVAARSA